LPGGTVSDGVEELLNGPLFGNVDFLILALGTNDVCKYGSKFVERHPKDLKVLISACKQRYPNANVSYNL